MVARSSGWLALSLVVLAAVLAGELHYGVGRGTDRPPAGSADTPPAASPPPLFALADREAFLETLSRPLFMPDRRPAGTAEAPVVAPAASPARPSA